MPLRRMEFVVKSQRIRCTALRPTIASMARYEHLPIYASAYRLALLIEQQVGGFSRSHKYAVGADLRELSRHILRHIVRANAEHEGRIAQLRELRLVTEELMVCLRLAKDVHAFSGIKAYEQAADLALSVSRQTEGWLKGQANKGMAGSRT